ncbi:MAG: hypothetical protein COZ86_03725 [Candidatus Moranbacteria bacterium CG_4_8_14_3_um_filter_41_13]|nr:MAG: hypothetical protein AUK58_00835 [Candidatus Moranbacteria bacterium CG2_30_41_165]PIP25624.1 MAG: hypothetical protein COX32_02410 [Candidatus Moranbacteria bacterium CG23_combo_of_CG06-09_8_20_14_all_41_28]PIV86465.1 MAG: hypothetical protein COW50_01230 [Candidatus Moranbacteria bacterium CG17_big_fil_post_rev_8_21_14_2_50_41_107]PIW93938.1 MAG: hypothetical protein COZ86_03725 [Candidatus Moranbacteria bacterium CG_4_8_14_3_um_filter_41_13]HCJ45628.1 hypothetical protein [Candidatus
MPFFFFSFRIVKLPFGKEKVFRRSSAVEQVTVETFVVYAKYMPEKRTYADRREYIKRAVMKRRKMIREKAMVYKGGECSLLRSLLEKSRSEE